MSTYKLRKLKALEAEARTADEQAAHTDGWESNRSRGATLTAEQIHGPADDAWARVRAEVDKQAATGNQYVVRMQTAMDGGTIRSHWAWENALSDYEHSLRK